MKVLLVDDHPVVRAGIRRLLEELPDVSVAEANSAAEAMRSASADPPDVVLTDISMPVISGLQLTTWLRTNLPEVSIIVLSVHASQDYVMQALQAGARGYLLKRAAMEEVEVALRTVSAGKSYLSPGISRDMVEVFLRRPAGDSAMGVKITPRQREILTLVAEGRSTKEIALFLEISARTVESHRAELMERLGARDSIALLLAAARLGLVTLQPEDERLTPAVERRRARQQMSGLPQTSGPQKIHHPGSRRHAQNQDYGRR